MPRVQMSRVGSAGLTDLLREYEQSAGITSSEFLARWQHGEFDEPGYFTWVGLCQLAIRDGVLSVPATEHSVPQIFA